MEEALEKARAKDTKERMAGVERLHQLLESSRKTLSSSDVTSLVDCCLDLLKDNNFRVSQGGLLALASAAVLSGDHLKLHFNALLPAVIERLGDGKQPVRDSARRLLLTLMEVSSPTIIVERAGSYAWTHKSWRVREEFARTVTAAIGLFASTELPLQRAILPPILQMLNDPNPGVREAAILCIEEMYTQIGPQFREELQRHHLPPSMVKDINAKLERIEPKNRSSDGLATNYAANDTKTANFNPKRSSPKAKNSSREVSLFGGDSDVTEKPVDAIKVYSEKELVREFEKIGSTLVPEKDWSIRIAAMQRVEGLVVGGAVDYPCFRGLLKQLVGPLSAQLADRRSTIVKQACHLLNFLSKELLGDFESCAEIFIPVLFKLVVITVLVIAESADNCIKTMLRNCKVSRSLSRIADCAKNDRSSILRARCCEYSVLILEYWADAPEIQRSADLYEDLIKCCVGDAMSEVRSMARACYRMFAKTWPERSRRLFLSFDPVIQRIINDEDGSMHKRHASPSIRDRSSQIPTSTPSNLSGYGTSAIVAMDRTASLPSGTSLSSGLFLSQAKSVSKTTERSLESVLHASKQKVTAIESMLRGLDINGRARSSSLDLGVDPPSSRDPPLPLAAPASNSLSNSLFLDLTTSTPRTNNRNGGLALSDIITQIQASKDPNKLPHGDNMGNEPVSSSLSSYSVKRVSERLHERGSIEDSHDFREVRRSANLHVDRQQYLETPYKDSNFRDLHNNHIPNFQRPLLRKNVSGRKSASRRRSFDDSQLSYGETPSYVDGPDSLIDALSEGLNPSSDWNARVSAFNYLRSLLEQGPKGIQEVTQSFEKVMKLFFQHLDDPHHKVAQAALSTLADLIPACRKPFESYMERILPHVFSRLIDPKELVRQPCSTTLEIVSKTYGTDSLLPALLRSLDEQRSPKAKLAVIEYAIGSFKKHAMSTEGSGNSGILKLWLAKLTPLVHDKNTKLKDAAATCIISVFTYFDPTAVLNYILSLSVEEQNSLRRALKQRTPRIEVDLMNFIQTKKERQRSRSSYDPSDVVGTSSEEGYIVSSSSKKSHLFGRYSSGSIGQAQPDEQNEHLYQGLDSNSNTEVLTSRFKDLKYSPNTSTDNLGLWTSRLENMNSSADVEASSVPRVNGSDHREVTAGAGLDNEAPSELEPVHSELPPLKINSAPETGLSIPQILHLVCNVNDGCSTETKRSGLQQLVEASMANDKSIWTMYLNQILTVVLEVLDDPDSSIRELSLSLLVEMVNNQKDGIEDSVEIVIEKLLHVTKDSVPKLANEAEHCLTIVLSQYDPFRCLGVIVPLLVTEDEKTLVTGINCLTKLVGRLSQEELMAQLSSFLPALFEAFGNQSADVRKTVVFCLVDIYIILGKAFLPYLEGLNSTQLRLVTIYANRISQARTACDFITPIFLLFLKLHRMKNHCVSDFEMDDDDYSIPQSPDLKRPKRSLFADEEMMELMWQNGQVVARNQNKKPLKESHIGEAAILSYQSSDSETGTEEEKGTQLLIQEEEMASWLHYPLEHSSFDGDFYADDIHYPTSCAPDTTTPSHAVTCVSDTSLAEVLQPPTQSAVAADPRPPMPPTRPLVMESPPKRYRNLEFFSRIASGSSSSTKAGRESTVVESHESPLARTGSEVSRGADVAARVFGGNTGSGTMSRTDAADTSSAQCELTVTSSSPVGSGTSVSVEPYKEPARERTVNRKHRGRNDDNAGRDSEDVKVEPADAKKPLTRRSRAAEVHSLSERKRRDRINEKMKALQELVPNCNKLDKASMLDEAIEYLKSLQMQLKMMSMGCGVVPVMFPGFQHYMPPIAMGMNQPMMVPLQNPAAAAAAAAAHLSPRFPIPVFHIPVLHGPGPSRIQPTNQSDPALNLLVSQNPNQAQIPSFANPYQQFLGHHQGGRIPLPKNKAMVHPSSSKPSGSKEAKCPDNHQPD